MNRFVSGLGVSLVVSGATVKHSIKRLGMRGHTTFSNLCNASQWFLWGAPHLLGIPPDKAMYAGLILTIFGARKRDAVETLIYKLGAEHGMGKGMSEYSNGVHHQSVV